MRAKQSDAEKFFENFESPIPRGISARYLIDQRGPMARWQDARKVYQSEALSYDPENPGDKVLIGVMHDRLIGISDNRHMLTIAGSRAGKSVGIISNLLFYRGSVLATDLKAELAKTTAARREALGQRVFVLDPFKIASETISRYRAQFNPLSVLTPELRTVIEDAGIIADALVVAGQSKDPHWDESARNFIEGIILHVISDPAFEGIRTLITVRQLLMDALMSEESDDEKDDKDAPFWLEEKMTANAQRLRAVDATAALGAAIEGAARDFYEKADRERDSVLSTARRHTKLLDYSSMREVLSGHDFNLSELKTDPKGITVYLCLPAGRIGMCSRWLRIFINQLLDAMERTRTDPAVPVLACLDEFPVLGYMKQLEDAVGQIASFGVKLWVVLQDWSQGKALYKERWESFAANAGVIQAFGINDLATSEHFARLLGKTMASSVRTVEVGTEQRQDGLTGRTLSSSLTDLMTADEIRRLFARDSENLMQLILPAGYFPAVLQRVQYFDRASPVFHYFEGKYAQR